MSVGYGGAVVPAGSVGVGTATGMGTAVVPSSSVGQTVVPVTGVRYKLKPYTYKYTYPVWKPDTKMAFTQTPYNNPCAGGCSSRNPHCCHKEVTYVPKTVPKVVEETVSVPVEVDVPNVSCGCHASRPHCCGKRRPVSSRSSGCSCHASAPHCCQLFCHQSGLMRGSPETSIMVLSDIHSNIKSPCIITPPCELHSIYHLLLY